MLKVTKDGCIDTLCTTVGLFPLPEKIQTEISVYPNPANDVLFIDIPNMEETEIYFFNLNGNIIKHTTATSGRNAISLASGQFQPGMYFWKVVNRNHELLQSGRIIIQ